MSDHLVSGEKKSTALMDRPVLPVEERTAARTRCCRTITVRLHSETQTQLEAEAYDLSETGIGLRMPYPLTVAEPLTLNLRGHRHVQLVTMPAVVIHATEENGGIWRIGCRFEEKLDRETLQKLL
jgi:hypothetical protein